LKPSHLDLKENCTNIRLRLGTVLTILSKVCSRLGTVLTILSRVCLKLGTMLTILSKVRLKLGTMGCFTFFQEIARRLRVRLFPKSS
jgi:hypothetical protein